MSNRVIQIGSKSQPKSLESEEIYIDIDMVSKPIHHTLKQRRPTEEYISLLVDEEERNPITDDQESAVQLQYTKNPNIAIDRYNEQQKQKANYRIAKSVNVRAVQNSLDNIFRWIPGERILNPEFGSKLYYLLYEGITKYNEEQIVAEIKSSVSKWEPRVSIKEIQNISTIDDTEDNTVVINIKYYIKGLPDTIFDKQYIYNRGS